MIKRIIKGKRIIAMITIVTFIINCNGISVKAEELPDEKEDPIIVVSLGDSYSSGEGITPFYGQEETRTNNPDWMAHRSRFSWPSQLKVEGVEGTLSEHKDENWFFVAASGAVTDNLSNPFEKEYDRDGKKGTYKLEPQLTVFDKFDENTVDYVTMTFGGNDVGFADIITTAVTDTLLSVPYLNPRKLSTNLSNTWKRFYANGGIKDEIKNAYKIVSEKAGGKAHIIVAGYPQLLEKTGKGALFTKNQAQEINASVIEFNSELAKLVSECRNEGLDIYFVSVEESFSGHEAYSNDPYIRGVILGAQEQDLKSFQVSSAYSVHPNIEGAKVYATCVQAQIDKIEAGNISEEEREDEGFLQDKLDEELEKQKQKMEEYIMKKLEEWLNQWLEENCGGC